MSILTDLKNTIVLIKNRLNNLSSRMIEVERSTIVSFCTASLIDYDATSDLFLGVTYTRSDATVAMRSILGSLDGTTGLYMQRTEVYYDATGVNIIRTVVYSITYNGLREPISEAFVSITP